MPKVVDKDTKKLEIIQAAMKVFAQKGVVKTRMIEIAEAAGIGKGTIYEYFRSKEEIFAEAFRLVFEDTEKRVLQALQSTDDPLEKLRVLIQSSLVEFIEKGEDFVFIMMDFWAEGMRSRHPDVLKIINLDQIYAKYRNIIVEILQDGMRKGLFKPLNAPALASILMASVDGLMLQWFMDKSQLNLQEVSQVLMDAFINGIRQ